MCVCVFSSGICDVCVLLVETYKQKRKKGTERVNSDHSPIPLLKREVKAGSQYWHSCYVGDVVSVCVGLDTTEKTSK